METLEHLSRRLDAFEDLREIVRTMKALAAVGIRQYEQAARSLAVYDRTVELGLHVLLRDVRPPPQPAHRHPEGVGAIVIGSDHGLCGRFNSDLVEYAQERLAEAGADLPPRLLAVGERAASLLEAASFPLAERMLAPGSVSRITDSVRHILLRIEAWQAESPQLPVYI
jgi:F-type H+-transporting ATPase subunit gamma